MTNLRTTRILKGFNQYDVALKTGIPQSKISLIERGYVAPKDDEKLRFAKALNCEVQEIFPVDE